MERLSASITSLNNFIPSVARKLVLSNAAIDPELIENASMTIEEKNKSILLFISSLFSNIIDPK